MTYSPGAKWQKVLYLRVSCAPREEWTIYTSFESSDSAHYGTGGCSCEKWCSFSQNGFHGNQVSNLGHIAKKYKALIQQLAHSFYLIEHCIFFLL